MSDQNLRDHAPGSQMEDGEEIFLIDGMWAQKSYTIYQFCKKGRKEKENNYMR